MNKCCVAVDMYAHTWQCMYCMIIRHALCRTLYGYQPSESPSCGRRGKSWLHNHFSACICIMCDPLRRCRGRFSSPFIWYISGTERRLTRHNISNQITCDQSNVVIVLGPYSFPSNECKSTPRLLRQWQQLHGGRRSVPPRHFSETFSFSPISAAQAVLSNG